MVLSEQLVELLDGEEKKEEGWWMASGSLAVVGQIVKAAVNPLSAILI